MTQVANKIYALSKNLIEELLIIKELFITL